ncbi:ATP-binding protein [Streptomyces sp. NPDC088785]|uniref:ATP-binding protein n=1 Tax=Streptomyces sp. NPDC088785 TaxID=3365897 RepID=UPI003812F60E
MRASTDVQGRTARVEYLMPQGSAAPRLARRLTRSFLAGHGGCPVADAELVVSELVTNATRASGGCCRMSLRIDADEVTVAVHDDGPGLPRQRTASQSAESGRGITLVRALARHWSVEPHPQGGKTVRAVLAAC